jgi:hypothetical protein
MLSDDRTPDNPASWIMYAKSDLQMAQSVVLWAEDEIQKLSTTTTVGDAQT